MRVMAKEKFWRYMQVPEDKIEAELKLSGVKAAPTDAQVQAAGPMMMSASALESFPFIAGDTGKIVDQSAVAYAKQPMALSAQEQQQKQSSPCTRAQSQAKALSGEQVDLESGAVYIDAATLSKHQTQDDAWMAIGGCVYDVSNFLEQHPGGAEVLLAVAGTDATVAFREVGHSKKADRMLARFKVGEFISEITAGDSAEGATTSPEAKRERAARIERKKQIQQQVRGERELLHASGEYEMMKPYFRDAGHLTYPALALSFIVALVTADVTDLSQRTTTAAATAAATATSATTTATTVASAVTAGLSISVSTTITTTTTAVTLFAHTFSTFGFLLLLYLLLSCAGFFRLSAATVVKLCLDPRIILASILPVCWLLAEFALLVGYGLEGLGDHVYDKGVLMKVYQLSLLLSFLFETIHWKARAAQEGRPSQLSLFITSCVPYFTAVFQACCFFLIASFCIDFSALVAFIAQQLHLQQGEAVAAAATTTDMGSTATTLGFWGGSYFSDIMKLSEVQLEKLFTVFYVIIGSALLRCFALRCFPERSVSDDTAHHTVLCSSLLGCVLTLAIGSIIFASYNGAGSTGQMLEMVVSNSSDHVFLVAYIAFAVYIFYLHQFVRYATASFALQAVSLLLMWVLSTVCPTFLYARWVAFGLTAWSLLIISFYNDRALEKHPNPPKYLCMAKQIEETYRYAIAITLARLLVAPIEEILTVMLPNGLRMYVYPGPVTKVGGSGGHQARQYGIAYQVNARKNAQEPTTFIANIGHFGEDLYDYARTASGTKEMMEELASDPESGEKGFVSDMVAIFPLPKKAGEDEATAYAYREVNISSWASEKAAHDWYVNSDAHKSIVREYHKGGLNEFSAMLSTLVAKKPIRWEVRCRECRQMSKGPGNGVCPHCGHDKMVPLPYM